MRARRGNRSRWLARGQAMTEHLILVCLSMMALMGMMAYCLDQYADFYMNVIKVICLPIP